MTHPRPPAGPRSRDREIDQLLANLRTLVAVRRTAREPERHSAEIAHLQWRLAERVRETLAGMTR